MKYLILLLLPLQVLAGFTPFAGAPISTTITGKGYLLSSNGSADTQLANCSDGEFLYWDATETTGLKCSGSEFRYGADVDGSYPNILHFNKGTSSAKDVGIFLYPNGSGTYESYIYLDDTANTLYIGNVSGTSSSIDFLIEGSSALLIEADGAVTISDTGGNGGNVPHNCISRSNTDSAAAVTATCSAGEAAVSGGCQANTASNYVTISYSTLGPTGSHYCAFNTSESHTAYAMCCDY